MHKLLSSFEQVTRSLCMSVDSPRSLGIYLRLKYSPLEILQAKIHPSDYLDPSAFASDYLIYSFLSKSKDLDFGIDTKAVAVQTFEKSERDCRLTNNLLKACRLGKASIPSPMANSVLFRARLIAARLLGEFSFNKVQSGRVWTTGASTNLRRVEAQFDNKISKLPISVSGPSSSYLLSEISHDPHWFCAISGIFPSGPYSVLRSVLHITDYGRLETVPKTAKTDRCIIVEPTGNTFLQKGVGSYIRKRLRSVGINLNDQSNNQRGALRAYHDGLSTIDLEAASDSISTELVFDLLPVDWFNYLNDLRSKIVKNGDTLSTLEKFSSMGNAFTFELESLIFYCLCKAVLDTAGVDGDVLVYGDDIIVPRKASARVIETLSWFGFRTNVQKTYLDGDFFESCGKHFFRGYDVTPVYQKEKLDDVEAIRCHNRIYRYCQRRKDSPLSSLNLRSVLDTVRRLFSRFAALRQPDDIEGDFGFLFVPGPGDLKVDRNYGFLLSGLFPVTSELPAKASAHYCYWLRCRRKADYPLEPLGDSVRVHRKRYVVKRFFSHSFYE